MPSTQLSTPQSTIPAAYSIQPVLTTFTEAHGRLPTEAEVIVMLEHQGGQPITVDDDRQTPTLIFRGRHYAQ